MQRGREKKSTWQTGLLLPPLAWVSCLFLLPLILVGVYSLATRRPYGGVDWILSGGSYLRLLEPLYAGVAVWSVGIAVLTTTLTLLLGVPVAYTLVLLPRRRRYLTLLLLMIPFWTNFLVRIYAWMFLLGREGPLSPLLTSLGLPPLTILFTPGAVLLGLVYSYLPFMVLPVYAAMERIDPATVEAAQDLYAKPGRLLWRLWLPLSLPGVAVGTVLVFIPSVSAFVIPDLLGGARDLMVGNLIQQQYLTVRDWPFGSALSMLLLFCTLVGVLFCRPWARRDWRRPPLVTGESRPPWTLTSGPVHWVARIITGGVFLFLYAPVALLILYSFNASRFTAVWRGFTLEWYARLVQDQAIIAAAWTSLEVALVSTLLCLLVGTAAALAVRRPGGSGVILTTMFLIVVIPEITLAVSLLLFFVTVGIPLGRTSIILAHATFSLPLVALPVRARLQQVGRDVEEAAMDLGADEARSLRHILLPLLRPALLVGGLLSFTASLDDFVVAYFVSGPGATTLPIRVYSLVKYGVTPEVNALSALLLVLSIGLITAALLWQGRRIGVEI
ncbi:MAG: ABC transporter permease subunit [Candidatus Methylomirabilales bacterium]